MAGSYGIQLTDGMVTDLNRYMEILLKWNKTMNLTAITQPEEVYVKHFLDSLLLLRAYEAPLQARVIDVGTGAGFPGIPLKIVRPDIELTLLDSLNKRVNFLQEVSDALGQDNICIHGRAEELGRDEGYREQYDVATARAVAGLPSLCEYCLPFVKVKGMFVALKGYDIEEEAGQARRAITVLGGKMISIRKFELPMENRRSIVLIQKITQTMAKYPRISAKITKDPL